MSSQPRPTVERVEVCDLCGEPVDNYGHRDKYGMYVGQPSAPAKEPKRMLYRFFRYRNGDRASGAPQGDYRTWSWDFHGECLVKALMPLVTDEARETAGVSDAD